VYAHNNKEKMQISHNNKEMLIIIKKNANLRKMQIIKKKCA
jgi:hypothetical protein